MNPAHLVEFLLRPAVLCGLRIGCCVALQSNAVATLHALCKPLIVAGFGHFQGDSGGAVPRTRSARICTWTHRRCSRDVRAPNLMLFFLCLHGCVRSPSTANGLLVVEEGSHLRADAFVRHRYIADRSSSNAATPQFQIRTLIAKLQEVRQRLIACGARVLILCSPGGSHSLCATVTARPASLKRRDPIARRRQAHSVSSSLIDAIERATEHEYGDGDGDLMMFAGVTGPGGDFM